jgi:hypothetical protein
VLRLLCKETSNSITPFEETAPAGTETTSHLHRNCDEVAHVLSGEITFEIGDRSAGRAPVPSCRLACHMLGKTPAPKQAACCLCIREPPHTSQAKSVARAALSRSGIFSFTR